MLLCVKQVNSTDLLSSTGNYTQYLVITYNGKESEKEYICIYMCVCVCVCVCIANHFAVHLKLTHCKLTILQFKKANKKQKQNKQKKQVPRKKFLKSEGKSQHTRD